MSSKIGRTGVVDWQELDRMMPFGNDEHQRRKRIALFNEMDTDGNGLLHITEVTRALFRRIPSARGIMDMRPVWTQCWRLARAALKPVVPIGIDFMEQAQFRLYVMSLWIYLRLWQCLWKTCPQGAAVAARPNDLQMVGEVFAEFGYEDLQGLESFLQGQFQNKYCHKIPFDVFVEICLKSTLPELSLIEEEYEHNNAVAQMQRIQPALLYKNHQVGCHKVQSLESLEARMTGFAVRKNKSLPNPVAFAEPARPGQWTTQNAMYLTATKFSPEAQLDPENHPCPTEKRLLNGGFPVKSKSAVDLHWDSSKRKSLNAAGNTIMAGHSMMGGSPQAPGLMRRGFQPYRPFQNSQSAAFFG
jgi:hypothetical protein